MKKKLVRWLLPSRSFLTLSVLILVLVMSVDLSQDWGRALSFARNWHTTILLLMVWPAVAFLRTRPAIRSDPVSHSLVSGIECVIIGWILFRGFYLLAWILDDPSVEGPHNPDIVKYRWVLEIPVIYVAYGYSQHAKPSLQLIEDYLKFMYGLRIKWWAVWWGGQLAAFGIPLGAYWL